MRGFEEKRETLTVCGVLRWHINIAHPEIKLSRFFLGHKQFGTMETKRHGVVKKLRVFVSLWLVAYGPTNFAKPAYSHLTMSRI
jgi:hypothetical protein